MATDAKSKYDISMNPAERFKSILDLLSALSLVNLCFLSVWRELLYTDVEDTYWIPSYTVESFIAILINVSVGTLIVYAVIRYLAPSQRTWLALCGRLYLLALLVFPLNYARIALDVNETTIHWLKDFWWISAPVMGVLSLLGLFLLVFRPVQIVSGLAFLCLVLSPFALMNLAQTVWSAIELASAAPLILNSEAKSRSEGKQRVLWILMDELDLRLAFLERPDWLVLPELDRFRNQSVFARNTISYTRNTEEAIPSFLLQKIVREAQPAGPANLRLSFMNFEETPDANFSQFSNFFTEATVVGARIAILGYYHPYCRLFREEAGFCWNYALSTYTPYATNDVFREAWSQILGITPMFRRFNGIRTYVHAVEQAERITADASFDLVYIHASVPHGPNIWDSEAQDFTLFNIAEYGYFENLNLADRFLGAVRRSMEDAGLWDQTAVLLTSDHEWRHTDLYDDQQVRKIPFILKMPGQETRFDFAPSFAPMQVTKDLLLEILERNLMKPEAVFEWLELRSSELTVQRQLRLPVGAH
jgi:hypothetical protein